MLVKISQLQVVSSKSPRLDHYNLKRIESNMIRKTQYVPIQTMIIPDILVLIGFHQLECISVPINDKNYHNFMRATSKVKCDMK